MKHPRLTESLIETEVNLAFGDTESKQDVGQVKVEERGIKNQGADSHPCSGSSVRRSRHSGALAERGSSSGALTRKWGSGTRQSPKSHPAHPLV